MSDMQLRIAARAAGERFFFRDGPCKFGHTSKRYVSTGACVECVTGKSPATPTVTQQGYLLAAVVPLNFSADDKRRLDTYLTECIYRYCEALNKPMPFNKYKFEWARDNDKPMSECPI